MAQRFSTFLMFTGRASEAIDLYRSLFEDMRMDHVDLYEDGEPGPVGTVKHAAWTLAGQNFAAIDSPIEHGFGFTPSMSIVVECSSDAEIERLFGGLSEGGEVMMPLDAYPFSSKFGWVKDRFGVSWQLSLA
ncbi:VOC family protein [Acuticoccus sp. M5D2P5]|uniref:VOC family protein n=1 Tax=Acuticoccus kalidii TaxID=2910977 RepID=UPI001F3A8276|nr:VOC family protein [Acuticoccus kalidii]MCF3933560.1 VOC family protein [Acuticoccus kalidii]